MKHLFFITIFIWIIASAIGIGAEPLLNEPERARAISDSNINRDDGRTLYRQVLLATCRYAVKGEKKSCRSRPVKKKIESVTISVGTSFEDTISIGIIVDPPSEKNLVFLQKDYDEEGKESDQWMYFPALKKLKRIIAQGDDSPKTGSVFGSEISYEDIEKRHLSNYYYSYDGIEKIDGRLCDKIIAFPTEKYQTKTSYSREELWIDQETKVALKRDLYDRQCRLAKTFLKRSIVNVSGVWINKTQIVVNHKSHFMSMEKITKLAINIPIDPELAGRRALKDTSFRERELNKIRPLAK